MAEISRTDQEPEGESPEEIIWQTSEDPHEILNSYEMSRLMESKTNKRNRKARLFMCACGDSISSSFSEDDKQMLEAIKKVIDRKITPRQLLNFGVIEQSNRIIQEIADNDFEDNDDLLEPMHEVVDLSLEQINSQNVDQQKLRDEQIKQSNFLRDIFGNPFSKEPVELDPRWLSSTVLDLAKTIYEEKVFERMPILSDALMDAGCDNEEIIKHCQGPGPHVRGCWVLDLLLQKQKNAKKKS